MNSFFFFADDQTLTRFLKNSQQNTDNLARAREITTWESVLNKKGNGNEIMSTARKQIPTNVFLDNQPLNQVKHFKHLGSTISSSRGNPC